MFAPLKEKNARLKNYVKKGPRKQPRRGEGRGEKHKWYLSLGNGNGEQPPRSCRSKTTTKTCDSAIGQHLPENPDCTENYHGDMFRIIGKARSSFVLAVLESIYISTKKTAIV